MDVDKAGDKHWCFIDCLTGKHTDMGRPCPPVPTINWVIAGGESGANARPVHPDWIRSLRDQCKKANVPFFFKQWGEWMDFQDATNLGRLKPYKLAKEPIHIFDDRTEMIKAGKENTGCQLDGRLHNEFPI